MWIGLDDRYRCALASLPLPICRAVRSAVPRRLRAGGDGDIGGSLASALRVGGREVALSCSSVERPKRSRAVSRGRH